jgi:hypothetical protein
MFQTKFVEKIKTHILCLITPFVKRAICDIMWKTYCTDGQASDDNIKWRMRITCCIPKARDTHSKYVTLLLFHCNDGYTNAPHYYDVLYIHCLPLFQYIRSYLARHVTVTKEPLNKEFTSH